GPLRSGLRHQVVLPFPCADCGMPCCSSPPEQAAQCTAEQRARPSPGGTSCSCPARAGKVPPVLRGGSANVLPEITPFEPEPVNTGVGIGTCRFRGPSGPDAASRFPVALTVL